MNIEREIIETDILIVGAGPAGLALAYRLATLFKSDNSLQRPEILIMEKSAHPGAHSLSGAVMDPRGISELIPDFIEKGAPLESPVTSDSMFLLTENKSIKFPFTPPSVNNHGCYVVSLNRFTGWLATQVESQGVDIFSGLAGLELVTEGAIVTGVLTVDMGLDKHGHPKQNFEPGSIIKAKVTVLCEGVRGSLTRMAFEKFPELTAKSLPQSYLAGVKEVWEVPAGRIKPGEVNHTIGWPQPNHEYGGGWIYGMANNLVSFGVAVGLDSPDPANDPHLKLQRFKQHPRLKKLLGGGTMMHYGAKAIPVNGYYAIPKLYHEGLLICGDSAGLLNPARLKGIHIAIKSGIEAAETLYQAFKKNDLSAASLSSYQTNLSKSWAYTELYKSRNFHAGFKGGLFAGLFHGALQLVTGGRGLFNRRVNKPDHLKMLKIEEYKARFGVLPKGDKFRFDNKYTFDKLTDVYKSGTMHEEEQPSHLLITDYDICNNRCTKEYGNPCQHFCPATVYNMVEDSERPGKLKLQLTPSNCVHCKTCDIADPYGIIRWVTPQGGEGPKYTNL